MYIEIAETWHSQDKAMRLMETTLNWTSVDELILVFNETEVFLDLW